MTQRPLVLVADDDPAIRELIAFGLERAGFATVEVSDGEEALEALADRLPAVAVLDVMMPRLDGLEVLRRLRADPYTSGLPVLLLTARARPEDDERGRSLGADDYVTKPFSPAELVARVRALADRSA